MTWQRAVETWRETDQPDDGFYVSKTASPSGKLSAVLAVGVESKKAESSGEKTFQLYKASTGMQSKLEIVSDLKRKYKKGKIVFTTSGMGKFRDGAWFVRKAIHTQWLEG